jgi:exodeoxyribonuclease V alpha subunit
MPVMSQHFVMLQRNLLYTAITRGKQLVVLIGTRKAVGIALANIRPRQRLSRLADRLAVKD